MLFQAGTYQQKFGGGRRFSFIDLATYFYAGYFLRTAKLYANLGHVYNVVALTQASTNTRTFSSWNVFDAF